MESPVVLHLQKQHHLLSQVPNEQYVAIPFSKTVSEGTATSQHWLFWHVELKPNCHPWKTLSLLLTIEFDDSDGCSAPIVAFQTIVFHPNINLTNGRVRAALFLHADILRSHGHVAMQVSNQCLRQWGSQSTVHSLLESLLDILACPDLKNVANPHAADLLHSDPDTYNLKNEECRAAIVRIMEGRSPHTVSLSYDPFAVAFSRLPRQATVTPPPDAAQPIAVPSWEEYRASWNTLGTTRLKETPSQKPIAPHVTYDPLKQPSARPIQPMTPMLAPSVRSLPNTAASMNADDLTWSFNLDDEFDF
jgi:ubiquitin-protein ligase